MVRTAASDCQGVQRGVGGDTVRGERCDGWRMQPRSTMDHRCESLRMDGAREDGRWGVRCRAHCARAVPPPIGRRACPVTCSDAAMVARRGAAVCAAGLPPVDSVCVAAWTGARSRIGGHCHALSLSRKCTDRSGPMAFGQARALESPRVSPTSAAHEPLCECTSMVFVNALRWWFTKPGDLSECLLIYQNERLANLPTYANMHVIGALNNGRRPRRRRRRPRSRPSRPRPVPAAAAAARPRRRSGRRARSRTRLTTPSSLTAPPTTSC